jgi:hypothetical protein
MRQKNRDASPFAVVLVGSCIATLSVLPTSIAAPATGPSPYFGIHLVDDQTGRGIPLMELRTVNDIALYSDSAGWVAFQEPGLMRREVFFAITGPGYEYPKDGFGFRGVRLTTTPGATVTVKVKRTIIAERLYRITGQGIYRDSGLLGLPSPVAVPDLVLGQDSVQAVLYQGRIFWLWGDTNLAHYPLGNFHTTGATSTLPKKGGFQPDIGVPLTYFRDGNHPDRVRAMAPLERPGAIWLFGLLTVPDSNGKEILAAHYSRHKSLSNKVEHGLVRFDDAAGAFQKVMMLDRNNTWRFPRGNAFRVREDGNDFFYFAAPFAHTRVLAAWESVRDPERYEALVLDRARGTYSWQRAVPPTTQADEQKLFNTGALSLERARYQLVDALSGDAVLMHGASIAWNEFRKKWLLIGVQQGTGKSPSFLGEVWYAEADSPTGPWRKAVKVVSHPGFSFYNPRHHAFLDEQSGRFIYFEGTYTRTFSGNPVATPRYEYNQIMYRLDLSDARLKAGQN